PVRLRAIDGRENLLGGLAQFEIGRVEQALLLLGIEQALRRQQLEHFDPLVELPAVGGRAHPQFALGFGQRDVEAFLAGVRSLHQELERDRGLPGPGRPLDQKHVLPCEPASQDIIQAPNTALCLTRNRLDHNAPPNHDQCPMASDGSNATELSWMAWEVLKAGSTGRDRMVSWQSRAAF